MKNNIEDIQKSMRKQKYITDRDLATTIYLSRALGKPILLEGEAGVGKTEVAKVMAGVFNANLIRLQCYEGLDVSTALYEWNYPKQMVGIKMEELAKSSKKEIESTIFSEKYLLKRPLLEAIQYEQDIPPVLLIDEIDRADEEFEAFLLEVLSDFQITIPEIGTIKAKERPFVILTSNRTRELHDALKRRCLYHWIDYPTLEKEYEIVITKVEGIKEVLSKQICSFMQEIRKRDFYKKPGIAETLDWALALVALNKAALDKDTIEETLGCIFKYKEDISKFMIEIGGEKVEGDKILKEWFLLQG
ncbi:MAG: MoxR family ATPase [Thermodesulfobacteriota bacterium]|nr:MoxR family ATPase [Thermodesulfobacteriota bacterium]